jgi:hypothetical protein
MSPSICTAFCRNETQFCHRVQPSGLRDSVLRLEEDMPLPVDGVAWFFKVNLGFAGGGNAIEN